MLGLLLLAVLSAGPADLAIYDRDVQVAMSAAKDHNEYCERVSSVNIKYSHQLLVVGKFSGIPVLCDAPPGTVRVYRYKDRTLYLYLLTPPN